jgi:hypothetical protein
VYIKQGFNPKEGAQLVTDIHDAVVNYTKSTGAGLEVEHAGFMYSRFVQNNMQMKKAMEIEKEDLQSRRRVGKIRQKRNVFDSIVSTLTGLVTAEQLRSEQEAEKALELKVARMLSHQDRHTGRCIDMLGALYRSRGGHSHCRHRHAF